MIRLITNAAQNYYVRKLLNIIKLKAFPLPLVCNIAEIYNEPFRLRIHSTRTIGVVAFRRFVPRCKKKEIGGPRPVSTGNIVDRSFVMNPLDFERKNEYLC